MTAIRKTQSKAKIKASFYQLLSQKSFAEISVSQICQQAKLNRGTFYLHYLDKYDLADQLSKELKEDFFHQLNDQTKPEGLRLLHTLRLIQAHQTEIQVLLKIPHINLFQYIQSFMDDVWQVNQTFKEDILFNNNLPANYAKASFLASLHAILELWISQNCQDSPEDIMLILRQLNQMYSNRQ